jgi:hypothetical protein
MIMPLAAINAMAGLNLPLICRAPFDDCLVMIKAIGPGEPLA